MRTFGPSTQVGAIYEIPGPMAGPLVATVLEPKAGAPRKSKTAAKKGMLAFQVV